MKKWKTRLGILCVFILGIAIGILGTNMYRQYKIRRFDSGGSDAIVKRIMEKYDRELDLTEGQHDEIEKIVRQSRQEWEEYRLKHQPEKEEIINRRLSRIKEHLNLNQQRKLDRMYEEKERKTRHHKNW